MTAIEPTLTAKSRPHSGIGYIDAHLLAAAAIGGTLLWTRDKRLREIATELGCAYREAEQ